MWKEFDYGLPSWPSAPQVALRPTAHVTPSRLATCDPHRAVVSAQIRGLVVSGAQSPRLPTHHLNHHHHIDAVPFFAALPLPPGPLR